MFKEGVPKALKRVQGAGRLASVGIRKSNSPWVVLLITLLLYGTFVQSYLKAQGGDVTAFIVAGSRFTDPDRTLTPLKILPGAGYDGQFYYALALKPNTVIRSQGGVRLDNPPYRQQRILYPFLSWLLAGAGRPERVLWAMVWVNLLGLGWIGWFGARWAQWMGRHALWGVAVPLFPGFLLVLARDLTEIVELAFLCAAVWAYVGNRHSRAAFCLMLAVLAKETALVVVLAAGICTLLSVTGRLYRPRWRFVAWPILAYGAWQIWIWRVWDAFSFSRRTVAFNVGAPLSLWQRVLHHLQAAPPTLQRLWIIELVSLGAFALWVWWAIFRSRAPVLVKVAWGIYFLLGLTLRHFLGGDWAFLRAMSEFYVLGAFILLGARTGAIRLFTPAIGWGWVCLALDVLAR